MSPPARWGEGETLVGDVVLQPEQGAEMTSLVLPVPRRGEDPAPWATVGLGELKARIDITGLLGSGDLFWLADALFAHGKVDPGDVPVEDWARRGWIGADAAAYLTWARVSYPSGWVLLDYASAVRWAAEHRPLLVADMAARIVRGSMYVASSPVPLAQLGQRLRSSLWQHSRVDDEPCLEPAVVDATSETVLAFAGDVAGPGTRQWVDLEDVVVAIEAAEAAGSGADEVVPPAQDSRPLVEQASHLLDVAMVEAGLTDRTLAERLGVTRQAVVRMRTGADMQIGTLEEYLAACGRRMVVQSAPLEAAEVVG